MGKVYRIGDEPQREKSGGGNPMIWALMGVSATITAGAIVGLAIWLPKRNRPTVAAVKTAPAVLQQVKDPAVSAPAPPSGGLVTGSIPQLGYSHRTGEKAINGYVPAGTSTFGFTNGLPSTPQDIIRKVKASVVLVYVDLTDGAATGTGFVVGPGQVATCAHVLEGAQQGLIRTADGQTYPVTAQSSDAANDVAVVRVGGSLPPPLPLGSLSLVREGDEIAVTGYPVVDKMVRVGFLPEASTSRGTVSAKRTQRVMGGVVQVLQIDAPINHGNSGGPVYSVRDGTVYGLAAASIVDTQGLNFASSIDALRRLIGR